MSDQFYAVEYREMETAIHHIAVFSLEEKAQEFQIYIEENLEVPTSGFTDPLNFVEDCEVDYRNMPTHSSEQTGSIRLIYIDEHNVVDIY